MKECLLVDGNRDGKHGSDVTLLLGTGFPYAFELFPSRRAAISATMGLLLYIAH